MSISDKIVETLYSKRGTVFPVIKSSLVNTFKRTLRILVLLNECLIVINGNSSKLLKNSGLPQMSPLFPSKRNKKTISKSDLCAFYLFLFVCVHFCQYLHLNSA